MNNDYCAEWERESFSGRGFRSREIVPWQPLKRDGMSNAYRNDDDNDDEDDDDV